MQDCSPSNRLDLFADTARWLAKTDDADLFTSPLEKPETEICSHEGQVSRTVPEPSRSSVCRQVPGRWGRLREWDGRGDCPAAPRRSCPGREWHRRSRGFPRGKRLLSPSNRITSVGRPMLFAVFAITALELIPGPGAEPTVRGAGAAESRCCRSWKRRDWRPRASRRRAWWAPATGRNSAGPHRCARW